MPGRPRTMMERVRALRAAAKALDDAITRAVPQQYRDRGAQGDPLAQAWLNAENYAFDTFMTLGLLLGYLSEKVASKGDDARAKATDILATLSDGEPEGPREAAEPQTTPAGPSNSAPVTEELPG